LPSSETISTPYEEVREMSHGRFDKPPETMKRSADGESVEACGPLRWDGDDPNDRPAQRLTIQRVEIKQGRARAMRDPSQQFQRGEGGPDWMVPSIPSDGSAAFEDGRAHAEAEVEVVLEDGQVTTERWRETVELSH
jgi:hypothetical protein